MTDRDTERDTERPILVEGQLYRVRLHNKDGWTIVEARGTDGEMVESLCLLRQVYKAMRQQRRDHTV